MRNRASVLIAGLAIVMALSGLTGCARKVEPPKAVAFARGTAAGTGEFQVEPVKQQPKEVWQVRLPVVGPTEELPEAIGSSLVVAESRVFVCTNFGELLAYELTSGKLIWSYGKTERGALVSVHAAADGMVLATFGVSGGTALRAADGHRVWGAQADSPTTLSGTTWLASGAYGLVALDWKNGHEKWQFRDETLTHQMPDSTAADDGVACFVTWDRQVVAVDAATGKHKWTVRIPPFFQYEMAGDFLVAGRDHTRLTRPVMANGLIYTVAYPWAADPEPGAAPGPARIYALEAASGKVSWQRDLSLPQRPGAKARLRVEAPAVSGSTLVLSVLADNETHGPEGFDSVLIALDATSGQVKWTNDDRAFSNIRPSPIVAGGVVYVSVNHLDSIIHALDLATGRELWALDLESSRNFAISCPISLVPVDGGLVATFNDGTLRYLR